MVIAAKCQLNTLTGCRDITDKISGKMHLTLSISEICINSVKTVRRKTTENLSVGDSADDLDIEAEKLRFFQKLSYWSYLHVFICFIFIAFIGVPCQ